ncbi:hypothetical protein CIRG_00797 [Coccidioides immitis RMSCC 2394]|uniref:Uncharacterized protein n=1 Tax=Coccidioides immitis RMSCC 2394 TaxID=404692 RepID=A0A0J6XZ20_COCIT|nr:hypothetical protein CIRG_00797 [Coccidioides immitis RMSCC 2394]
MNNPSRTLGTPNSRPKIKASSGLGHGKIPGLHPIFHALRIADIEHFNSSDPLTVSVAVEVLRDGGDESILFGRLLLVAVVAKLAVHSRKGRGGPGVDDDVGGRNDSFFVLFDRVDAAVAGGLGVWLRRRATPELEEEAEKGSRVWAIALIACGGGGGVGGVFAVVVIVAAAEDDLRRGGVNLGYVNDDRVWSESEIGFRESVFRHLQRMYCKPWFPGNWEREKIMFVSPLAGINKTLCTTVARN